MCATVRICPHCIYCVSCVSLVCYCLQELSGALGAFIAQQALTTVTQRTIQTFLYTGEHNLHAATTT
jgi:hypothetical protein